MANPRWTVRRQNDSAENYHLAPVNNNNPADVNYAAGIILEPGGELVLPGKGNLRVGDEINYLKSSVANGKFAIAQAISGKGVPTAGGEEFASMASKINQIQVGGRTSTSGGWIGVDATVDAPWNINVGFRPKTVFFQYRIVYGVMNVYNDYVYMRQFGYGVMTPGGTTTREQHVQNDGFTGGPQTYYGTSFAVGQFNSDPITDPDTAINFDVASNGSITSTGFTLNYGWLFRDSRGGNWANINWKAFE